MSETLCTLRGTGGGGGRYKETSLWTNSAPTSGFAGQEVTLSDSIDNYKYIKINYAYAASYNTGKCNTSIIVSVDDFKKMTYNTSDRHNIGSLSVQNQANVAYNRILFYVSNTTVRFGTCYQQGTNTASNTNNIPLEILGLNELDHGKRFDETVLWTNPSPSSEQASAAKTLDTGKFSDYDFIKLVWWFNTTTSTTYSTCVPYSEFIKFATGTGTGQGAIFIGTTNSSNLHFARPIYYSNDTSFQIGSCYQAASNTLANAKAILVNIIGCKFR